MIDDKASEYNKYIDMKLYSIKKQAYGGSGTPGYISAKHFDITKRTAGKDLVVKIALKSNLDKAFTDDKISICFSKDSCYKSFRVTLESCKLFGSVTIKDSLITSSYKVLKVIF